MTLTNEGGSDDQLVSAASDGAESVELHMTTTDGASATMQQVEGIDIPAGGNAVLAPGGYHAMLIDVTEGLAEGDTVELTLTCERADEQTIAAEVVPVGDVAPMGVVVQSDAFLPRRTILVALTPRSARAASFRPEVDIDGDPTRVLVEQMGMTTSPAAISSRPWRIATNVSSSDRISRSPPTPHTRRRARARPTVDRVG